MENTQTPGQAGRPKKNYQAELEKILGRAGGQRSSLLLHACCGPCSSYIIEYLAKFFDITIYYYNPNIFPKKEYDRRLLELEAFLEDFEKARQTDTPAAKIKLVKARYEPEEYYEATNARNEAAVREAREKGERCWRCYELRMREAFRYAVENSYDWFCTSLSISPHKDAEKINAIGRKLERSVEDGLHKTKWLPSDFKKKGGFKRSLELSAEFSLYRQDYCGCEYSSRQTTAPATD